MINLITGGSGFVGKNLIKKLLENEEEIWILVRKNKTSFEDWLKKEFPKKYQMAKILTGDITKNNLGLSEKEIDNFVKVKVNLWHLAANLSFATKDKKLVFQTNYEGTKNVVQFANKIKAEKIIYVSTAYVSGDYIGKIYEDKMAEGQNFRNGYEKSKYQAEKYLRENFKNKYLIVRPSVILGEVYTGKAEGCTFGYYRFLYMFYLFKLWMIKKLQGKIGFWKIVLKFLGTKYDKKTDKIYMPWLLMLYIKTARVDLVPVDFVVNSMVEIHYKQKQGKEVVHLTNAKPAKPKFLMDLIFDSLGYKKTKAIYVPKWILFSLIKIFYILTFPIRSYTKSIYWYLPYFTREYDFDRSNFKKYNLKESHELNTEFMARVNEYAKKEIFDKIEEPKL